MNQFFKTCLLATTVLFVGGCTSDLAVEPKSPDNSNISKTNPPTEVVASASILATGVCNFVLNESALTSTGWTKVFEDEFTTNLSKWNIWYGGAYNYELQLYQANNLQLLNGELLIHAKKETVIGPTRPDIQTPSSFNYTSGRIESKTLFSASRTVPRVRIMARIKLPAGYGMWPAFWSYGDPWPTQGEIDILEARGQEPYNFATNYFYGRAAGKNLVTGAEASIASDVDLTTCYHVYELIWSKNDLTFLFDGKVVDIKSGGYIPNIFGKSEKITLNLAVGGLFFPNLNPSLIQTGTMAVDWVKVFTAK